MIERINKLLSKSISEVIKDPWELKKIYKQLFNEDVCGYCPPIITEKYNALKLLTKENIKAMQERILKMKSGMVIDTYSSELLPQGAFTKDNITDEIAIKFIKHGYGKFFENPQDVELAIEKTGVKESEEEEYARLLNEESSKREKEEKPKQQDKKLNSTITKK